MRQGRDGFDFLHRKSKPDACNGLDFAQMRERVVIIPGAIADAMAQAVERGQRHQHDVGNDFRRRRRRLGDTERPEQQPVIWGPRTKDQRLAARGDRRQRKLCAAGGEFSHQRQWIDLAADRRIAGNHRALRQLKRQSARGNRFGRGRALLARVRVARGKRYGPELVFRPIGFASRHAALRSVTVTRESERSSMCSRQKSALKFRRSPASGSPKARPDGGV